MGPGLRLMSQSVVRLPAGRACPGRRRWWSLLLAVPALGGTLPARAQDADTAPPPINVHYLQYGVAVVAEGVASAGDVCPGGAKAPCILGSGGGLAVRVGYRSRGPWYVGGAYEFIKMDSGNLYRLGIFQQLRAEIRYYPDIGLRAAPYVTSGPFGLHTGVNVRFRVHRNFGFIVSPELDLQLPALLFNADLSGGVEAAF